MYLRDDEPLARRERGIAAALVAPFRRRSDISWRCLDDRAIACVTWACTQLIGP